MKNEESIRWKTKIEEDGKKNKKAQKQYGTKIKQPVIRLSHCPLRELRQTEKRILGK
jgi:hypothetical protein